MGNPLQEKWIARHRADLRVQLAMGVGGSLRTGRATSSWAPVWMRKLRSEWVHILISQPHKFRRYVFGNPLLIARVAREKLLGPPSA